MSEKKLLILTIMAGIITLVLGWTMSSIWHGVADMISAVCFVVLFDELVGGLDESNRGTVEKSKRLSGTRSA